MIMQLTETAIARLVPDAQDIATNVATTTTAATTTIYDHCYYYIATRKGRLEHIVVVSVRRVRSNASHCRKSLQVSGSTQAIIH